MNSDFIDYLKGSKNIEPDEHSGSYELVRQGVARLAKLDFAIIDVCDLEMLYHFGNLRWGKKARDKNIEESNLLYDDKQYMLNLNKQIAKGTYSNHPNSENGNCGLFDRSVGKLSRVSKEIALIFVQMLISISNISDDRTNEIFDIVETCLSQDIKGIGVGIASQILHLLKPNLFPILNTVGRKGYRKLGLKIISSKGVQYYIQDTRPIYDFKKKELPNINFRTIDITFWENSENISNSIPDTISYWFVGANWSGVNMSEIFTTEGYWENGYDDKYVDVVNSVKVGDKIAIKNTYRQKRNLPFENAQERDVSCMGIKAIGTVTKNHNNGKHLNVEWHSINLTKVWYFFSYWGTIEQIKPDNWKTQALIDFAFNGIEQNIEKFQEHYWEADNVKTENDVVEIKEYYKEDFLKEVYVTPDKYEDMVGLLERKKNIILQGAPGVGKSFLAKKLAYSLMGAEDDSRVKMIQFHQSYSYEDFIKGYRPNEEGKFDLINGVFYEFCMNKAKNDLQNKYYFIIDEINRGNLSKIFGELMLLIEHDKRGEKHQMPTTYDKKGSPAFFVPENIYIIGMMNTADRSLALPDYALRRRFSFINIEPAFNHKGFKRDFNYNEKQDVIDTMNALNDFIGEKIDIGHKIGHSYFCKFDGDNNPIKFTDKEINNIFRYEIKPMIDEYFVDDDELLKNALRIVDKWLIKPSY